MINCSCGMINRQKALRFISSRDHWHMLSTMLSTISVTGFAPGPGFSEWSCALVKNNIHVTIKNLLEIMLITEKVLRDWYYEMVISNENYFSKKFK